MDRFRVNFLLNAIPKHKDAFVQDKNMCDRVLKSCDMLGNYNFSHCDGILLKRWHDRLLLENRKGSETTLYNVNNSVYAYDKRNGYRLICRNYEQQKDKFITDLNNGMIMEYINF